MLRSICLTLTTLLTACSGAAWSHAQFAPGYAAPKKVAVVVEVKASGEGLDQAVAKLKESVLHELLAEHGIQGDIVDAGTAAQDPTVHVVVTGWDPGSRAGRNFLGVFGVGKATMDVEVRLPDARSKLEGEVVGYIKSGVFGGSAETSGEEAGAAIADAIATGRVEGAAGQKAVAGK